MGKKTRGGGEVHRDPPSHCNRKRCCSAVLPQEMIPGGRSICGNTSSHTTGREEKEKKGSHQSIQQRRGKTNHPEFAASHGKRNEMSIKGGMGKGNPGRGGEATHTKEILWGTRGPSKNFLFQTKEKKKKKTHACDGRSGGGGGGFSQLLIPACQTKRKATQGGGGGHSEKGEKEKKKPGSRKIKKKGGVVPSWNWASVEKKNQLQKN